MSDFIIDNDKAADWALNQIAEAEAERDRLIKLAEDKIKDLQEKIEALKTSCESDTAYLKSLLYNYFRTVKPKDSKTQQSYKLLSGSLVFKKPSVKITHNDEALLKYLEENDGKDYIKIKKTIDWAEFKKNLTVSESGEIIDSEIGTIIPVEACKIVDVPASFNIKF